jgi:peptidoglycan hydrolase-like protein with peptidoglycan-binding domain
MYPSPKNLLTDYAPRTETEGTTLGGWFDLDDWVGPQRPSKRPDIAKIEGILANSGDYSLERTQGPTGYWGLSLDDGIRKYQKRNGLKVDGTLRPGGPTIRHMQENFATLLDGHTPPTPEDIDAHHEVVGDDNPGTIAWRKPPVDFTQVPDLPEIDQEADASNARLARGMLKTGDIDSYAQLMRDAIEQGGKNGLAEVADLAAKLDEASPGLGGRFGRAIYDGMTKAQQDRLELEAEGGQPPGTVQVAGGNWRFFDGIMSRMLPNKNRAQIPEQCIAPPYRPDPKDGLILGPPAANDENKPIPPSAPSPIDSPNHTGGSIEQPEASDYIETFPASREERKKKFVDDLAGELAPIIFEHRSDIFYGEDGGEKREDKRAGKLATESNNIGAEIIRELIDESDCAELIDHDGGGSEDGKYKKYLKEKIIKALGGDRRADLTATLNFKKTGIESRMHINTATMDALGNPIPREADAVAAMAATEGSDRVGLFRKLRAGEDREAYKKEFKSVISEKLQPVFRDCQKFLDGFK